MKENAKGSVVGEVATSLVTASVVAMGLPALLPQQVEAWECKDGFHYAPEYNFCVPDGDDCSWCS